MEITVKEKIELLEEGMQTLIDEVVRLNEIQEKSSIWQNGRGSQTGKK